MGVELVGLPLEGQHSLVVLCEQFLDVPELGVVVNCGSGCEGGVELLEGEVLLIEGVDVGNLIDLVLHPSLLNCKQLGVVGPWMMAGVRPC